MLERASGEIAAFVKRFKNLSSQMKEMTHIKELVKIWVINVEPAAWFLSGPQYDTFEQLFNRVLLYEKLDRI